VRRLTRKPAVRIGIVGLIVTVAAGIMTAAGVGAQTPDSPELALAKGILRDAPAAGFQETAPGTTPGSSGPLVGATVKVPSYDALSGLSLSFEARGYQRYWANKTGGGIVGVIGVELPEGVRPATFVNDFEKWSKVYGGKPGSIKGFDGAKQATLTVSDSAVFELAFTVGNRGFLVIGSGAIVSDGTVLEVARRQQAFSMSQPVTAPSATPAAAPTAAPAAAPAAAAPAVAPAAQDPAVAAPKATAGPAVVPAATVDASTPDVANPKYVSAGGDSLAKRFLRAWLRLGAAGFVFLGIGALIMRVGAPYRTPKPVATSAAAPLPVGMFGSQPQMTVTAARQPVGAGATYSSQLPFG
jgi:hypothetical protein